MKRIITFPSAQHASTDANFRTVYPRSMRDISPATEVDVILAFLQAEIDSARFGPSYAAVLSNFGLERGLIVDQPDLKSDKENRIRRELLTAVRGYGNRTFLFQGFPQDVTWRKVAITNEEVGKLKYAKYDTWLQFSNGSRLVIDGAKGVDTIQVGENANENIVAVANDLRSGKRYPALIAVESEGGLSNPRGRAYAGYRICSGAGWGTDGDSC